MRVSGGPVALLLILLVAVVATVPAVPAGPETSNASVQVSNFRFTPATVTIQAGEQVTWDWTSGTHSVETRNGADEWCGVRSSGSCAKSFPTPGTYDYRCGVHPSSMLGTVVVQGETPQVVIGSPSSGESFEDDFTASGTASHSAGISAVRWSLDSATVASPVDVLQLDGTTATWSTLVSVAGLAGGQHTLRIQAEATDGTVTTSSVTFQIIAPDAVDLQVNSLTVTSGIRSAQLFTSVKNTGTLDVTGAQLRFEYHYQGTWRTIASFSLDIGVGQSLTRGTTWDSDGKIGAFDVRAIVDPDGAIPESDETNNVRQGRASFGSSALPGFDPFEPL